MKALLVVVVFIFSLWSGFPPVASAQVTEAAISADGSGLTREEAVQTALVNAASQAFGVELRSSTVVQSLSAETSADNEDHSAMLSSLNKNIQQVLHTPSNAPILGYAVDNAAKSPEAGWEATVTLRYAKFERLGADSSRRSVVVVSNSPKYRQMLVQTVGESLVGSRRFDVLNRENDRLFQEEKSFILGDDAASAEMARLSQATGADYLVLAELQSLGISNNNRETIRMTGEVLVNSSVSGALRLQVVEFASRKVKWSASQKFGATYPGASSIGSAALVKLIGEAADRLVGQMVASIYPIRVVKVMDDTAIINRGEGSAVAGEIYAVFRVGEELTDPQSGESLGAMETEVGLGKVTEVKPKFSFLKMASGTLVADADYILRKTDKKWPASTVPAKKTRSAKADAVKKPQTPSRKDVFLN